MKIVAYSAQYFDSYKALAEHEFGKNAFQGTQKFLDWMYGDAASRCLLALDGERVIGFIHKMVMPFTIEGETTNVTILNNLVMHEDYRSGQGMMLLMRSYATEKYAIAPGVVGDLATAYVRLKHKSIDNFWFRRIISPWNAGLSLMGVTAKTKLGEQKNGLYAYDRDSLDAQNIDGAVRLLGQSESNIAWNADLLRWRYFAANGPRCLLLCKGEQLAIVSMGKKKGMNAARLLEAHALDQAFINDVIGYLRRSGIAVLLGYSAMQSTIEKLQECGFSSLKEPPNTFWITKQKDSDFLPQISACATDVGLEAIQP